MSVELPPTKYQKLVIQLLVMIFAKLCSVHGKTDREQQAIDGVCEWLKETGN